MEIPAVLLQMASLGLSRKGRQGADVTVLPHPAMGLCLMPRDTLGLCIRAWQCPGLGLSLPSLCYIHLSPCMSYKDHRLLEPHWHSVRGDGHPILDRVAW